MKIFRKVAEPARYMVIGHDGPRPLAESTLNTFTTSIPVKPGDVLGLNQGSGGGGTQCRFPVPGELDHPLRFGNLGDSESEDFIFGDGGYRLNISAVLVPTNTFKPQPDHAQQEERHREPHGHGPQPRRSDCPRARGQAPPPQGEP